MDLQFSCSIGSQDIRDYTFVDALRSIGREQGEDFKFAVWPSCQEKPLKYAFMRPGEKKGKWEDYSSLGKAREKLIEFHLNREPPENLTPEELEERIFKQYEVKILNSSGCEQLGATSVLIPLNSRALEKQVALRVVLDDDGILVIKDGNDNSVGSLTLESVFTDSKDKKSQQDKAQQVRFVSSNPKKPLKGELIISQDGKLILNPQQESLNLFLGKGFTFYEMDLIDWPPVEDQTPGHLCAANAGVSLLEYFERTTDGRHLNASRLFLHKAACNLSKLLPDAGPSVRAVVNALSVFGVPPEDSWPYDLTKLYEEPPAWCYAQARNYRAASYLKLDRPGIDKTALITQIKVFVYSGLPAIFGLSVHESVDQSWQTITTNRLLEEFQAIEGIRSNASNIHQQIFAPSTASTVGTQGSFDPAEVFCNLGSIPFPTFGELQRGGHAAVVVGYDDEKVIVNSNRLRRSDRDRLGRQRIPAFLLKSAPQFQSSPDTIQYESYKWNHVTKRYEKDNNDFQDFKSTAYSDASTIFSDASGLFILLVRRDKQESSSPDCLIPGSRSFDLNAVEEDGEYVDEYLATKGAFKIRNSWGKEWGEKGYGYLPYAYVYQDLTFDWWSILKFEWMNTEEFGLLRRDGDLVMCDPRKRFPC